MIKYFGNINLVKGINMKVLGITFESKGYRYCVLEGDKENPVVIKYEKLITPKFKNHQELVNWYESSLQNLINIIVPDSIGIKLSLNANKAQISPWYYSTGILHSIACKKSILTHEFVSQNFTATKFGLEKGTDIYDYIDSRFGIYTPKWDKNQKYALLSGWMLL